MIRISVKHGKNAGENIWISVKHGKNAGENINISAKESLDYYELKKHKPCFDKGCSKLLDQTNKPKKWR
jgi:hypothetical protein